MTRLLPFLLLATLASCQFDLPDEAISEQTVPLQDLQVPDGFNFETTKTIQISVSAKDAAGNILKNVPFQLFLPDGENLTELLTASTGQSGSAALEVSLPAFTDTLLVTTPYLGLPSQKIVPVGNSSLEIIFGEENKEGFAGGNGDVDADELFLNPNQSNPKEHDELSESVGSRSVVSFHYLGTYNNSGKPNYLATPNDVVSQAVLNVINSSLPEAQPVPTYHPEFLENDLVSTINLVETAQVWVTFVHEGAGYRNALGYYTYPSDEPPTSVDDIDSLKIIFPNVSFQGSGGQLVTGQKVSIGTFSAGTSIGWFLVPDGWNNTTKLVVPNNNIKFSDEQLNTFTSAQYRRHVVLLYDQSLQKVIMGMEDINRPGGDNDFNDAIFYVTASSFNAIETDNLAAADNNSDSDGDGVSNSVDVAPNDPTIAFYAYTPGQGQYASLVFEDLFPRQGDYDMNDVVVDYHFKEYLNSQNDIVKMDITLKLRALGGVQHNGFGIELGVLAEKTASVTGSQISGNGVTLSANGIETKQAKAVLIAFNDGLSLMNSGDSFVNTDKAVPSKEPITVLLQVQFTEPVTRQTLGTAPFNPFIFSSTLRNKEIHLPGKPPTSLANPDYFASGDDASNPSAGIYYKTADNLPFAINIPLSFDYPTERTPINVGHLKFAQWAQSGGSLFADWYKDLNGYRAATKIY